MIRFLNVIMAAGTVAGLATACSDGGGGGGAKALATARAGSVNVAIATSTGKLHDGKNDVTVTFTDAKGQPDKVRTASIKLFMPAMGSMAAMTARSDLKAARIPGAFTGTVDVPMKGTWQARVSFKDASGSQVAKVKLTAL